MKKNKQLIIYLLLFISLFGINFMNVFAAWTADVLGDTAYSSSSSGYSGGTSNTGYVLKLVSALQVCMVDVVNSPQTKDNCLYYKSYNYTTVLDGTGGYTLENAKYQFMDVTGMKTMNPEPIQVDCDHTTKLCWWSDEAGWGLNFNAKKISQKFISDGKLTPFFENIVKQLLKKKGWTDDKINSIDLNTLVGLDENERNDLSNHRIIVEPIYAFEKVTEKYKHIFATLKGIAKKTNSSSDNFGVSVSNLYNNNFTNNSHGKILKNDTGDYYNDLKNPLNTRGYSIYKVINEDVCTYDDIKKKHLCSDGRECEIDDFITECGCDAVEISKLNLGQKTIYNTRCTVTTDPKVEGNLRKCTVDSPLIENYKIKYGDLTDVDETNTSNEFEVSELERLGGGYCKLRCEETFEFKEVSGRYKDILAGTYFQINPYPKTLVKKDCKVTVEASSWYDKYKETLTATIDSFNKYQNYLDAKNKITDTGIQCCAGERREYVKDADGNYVYDEYGNRKTRTVCVEYKTWYEYPYAHNKGVDFQDAYTIKSGISLSGTYMNRTCGKKTIPSVTFDPSALIKLLDYFDNCNKFLFIYGSTNRKANRDYYKYQEDLDVDVEQWIYDESTKTYIKKKNTLNNDFDLELKDQKDNGNSSTEYLTQKTTFNILNSSGVTTKEIYTNYKRETDYELKRWVELEHTYINKKKYTESYTGKILTETSGNLIPTIALGYGIYEIDLIAVHNPIFDNTVEDNKYIYTFKKLGDNDLGAKSNGQLYQYFADGKTIKSTDSGVRSGTIEDLKRYCEVGVINDIPCFPQKGDRDCPVGDDPTTKILYKIVDPLKIDPNDRIGDNSKGFENWKNNKGNLVKNDIENTAKTDDTFNPDNLEYSFELDSRTIKEIRDYNNSKGYESYLGYKCDEDGNYCRSSFIDNFAIIKMGREKWKTFDSGGNLTELNTAMVNYS